MQKTFFVLKNGNNCSLNTESMALLVSLVFCEHYMDHIIEQVALDYIDFYVLV